MRAIWSGPLSFGLVDVPVQAYSAAQDHGVHLRQSLDAGCGRIRYQRRREVCGKEIDDEHIGKATGRGTTSRCRSTAKSKGA